jgi:hypothetical protein
MEPGTSVGFSGSEVQESLASPSLDEFTWRLAWIGPFAVLLTLFVVAIVRSIRQLARGYDQVDPLL